MNKVKILKKRYILNENRNLSKLISPWLINMPEITLNNITLDSRKVNVGDLFIAVFGHITNGHNYLLQAISKGSHAIILETKKKYESGKISRIFNVPIISMYKLKEKLSMLAGRFYGHPSFYLKLIGVTGTNGKTTVVHLLAQWVKLLNNVSAIMGTIGNGITYNLKQNKNTTESATEIQRYLYNFFKKNVTLVSIEVSSHSLAQNRVNGLHFSAAIFINLSHDHLDYHEDMLHYKISKWRLFNEMDVDYRIINIDDYIGLNWINKLPVSTTVAVSSQIIKNRFLFKNWLYASKVNYNSKLGITEINFHSSWGNGLINSKLIGEFNTINLLLALATLLILGYPISLLTYNSIYLKPVCGRMELFKKRGFPNILIDYAHNPEALKQVLINARRYCRGKLWCIFGCGGERDISKRSIMGSIAEFYSDKVIITADNPRSEPLQKIINNIMSGILYKNQVEVIPDREEAIIKIINKAKLIDLILILGKGHENYQIVGNCKLKYSDLDLVSNLLEN